VGVALDSFFVQLRDQSIVQLFQLPIPLQQTSQDVFVVTAITAQRSRVVIAAID
jgi:hypothetical protein